MSSRINLNSSEWWAMSCECTIMSLVVCISNFQCLTKNMRIRSGNQTPRAFSSQGSSVAHLSRHVCKNTVLLTGRRRRKPSENAPPTRHTGITRISTHLLSFSLCQRVCVCVCVWTDESKQVTLLQQLASCHPVRRIRSRIRGSILRDTWAALGLNEVHTPPRTSKPADISPVQSTN